MDINEGMSAMNEEPSDEVLPSTSQNSNEQVDSPSVVDTNRTLPAISQNMNLDQRIEHYFDLDLILEPYDGDDIRRPTTPDPARQNTMNLNRERIKNYFPMEEVPTLDYRHRIITVVMALGDIYGMVGAGVDIHRDFLSIMNSTRDPDYKNILRELIMDYYYPHNIGRDENAEDDAFVFCDCVRCIMNHIPVEDLGF